MDSDGQVVKKNPVNLQYRINFVRWLHLWYDYPLDVLLVSYATRMAQSDIDNRSTPLNVVGVLTNISFAPPPQ